LIKETDLTTPWMRFLWCFRAGALAAVLFVPISLPAQSVIGARPGLINYIVGDVSVDGQAVHVASQNYPLMHEGQVVRTDRGRAEILLAPEVILRLGEWAALRLVSGHPENTQIELQTGVALVEVVKMPRGNKIQIQCAGTSTEFGGMGVYRFDANSAALRVYGGKAEVSSTGGRAALGRGKAAHLADTPHISKFPTKDIDPLYRWAAYRSFFLFTHNPEAMANQTHWGITASGWAKNRSFQISLFSPLVAMAFAKKRFAEQEASARMQQTLDYLRALEQERARQAQIQQQREQQPNR
jgi:hypothetical protein